VRKQAPFTSRHSLLPRLCLLLSSILNSSYVRESCRHAAWPACLPHTPPEHRYWPISFNRVPVPPSPQDAEHTLPIHHGPLLSALPPDILPPAIAGLAAAHQHPELMRVAQRVTQRVTGRRHERHHLPTTLPPRLGGGAQELRQRAHHPRTPAPRVLGRPRGENGVLLNLRHARGMEHLLCGVRHFFVGVPFPYPIPAPGGGAGILGIHTKAPGDAVDGDAGWMTSWRDQQTGPGAAWPRLYREMAFIQWDGWPDWNCGATGELALGSGGAWQGRGEGVRVCIGPPMGNKFGA